MYLFHATNLKSLKLILKDGYLKSSKLSKNTEGEGQGLYEENKFVFFSCIDKLFSRKIYGDVILYFNSKLLYNKSFYTGNIHSIAPDLLLNNEKKYKKNYKNYDIVLKKLFKSSLETHLKAFQVFQQIAVLNKVNLKELVAIEFNKKSNSSIIKFLNEHYPDVIIKLN